VKAGRRSHRVAIQQRDGTVDAAGQPVDTWTHVCYLFVNIGHDTGKAAIRRSGDQVGTPYAQYSFAAPLCDVRRYNVTDGMRVVHDSLNFDIKGITQNLQDRTEAFIVCELGGNEG
jgi:head-tail adaptor